jgi:hypothetical protein
LVGRLLAHDLAREPLDEYAPVDERRPLLFGGEGGRDDVLRGRERRHARRHDRRLRRDGRDDLRPRAGRRAEQDDESQYEMQSLQPTHSL